MSNKLDIDYLLDFFGGVAALAKALQQHFPDQAPSAAAIYKWRQRQSLPLHQLNRLYELARQQGRILQLQPLLTTTTKTEKQPMKPQQVIIFDTTLRDGEQSPGAAMNKNEKIRIARMLEKLGVNVIEAGFAAASPGDFAAISAVAKAIQNATVCSLARAHEKDIRRAGEALDAAAKKRIHTFIATSPLHMEHKLKMTPSAVIAAAEHAIKIAREYTDDVEFSCEDALRSDPDFLVEICSMAIAAGATTINIPDTVGYSIPAHTEAFFRDLIGRTAGGDNVIWSAHCHNDLGLATANSLAALRGGARQVECTINGLGERAGNAALEEIVMALTTRHDLFGLETQIDTTQITPASRLVAGITGYNVQPNKAIVGANAFAHESGIHQDGVLKCRETYEIMSAESVGLSRNRLSLGKLSGRNAFRNKLTELGIELTSEEALNDAFRRFKELADKKREIFDDDIHALISDSMSTSENYQLHALKIISETGEAPQAEIVFGMNGEEKRATSSGSGAVDAIFSAIEQAAVSGAELELYSVNAITAGTESQGEVTVRLARDGCIVNGQGADVDILIASAKAYLSALDKLDHISRHPPEKPLRGV